MADVAIRPIHRLLVANRGEIARRIFRTAHDMGKSTVAVYAASDANAPFVTDADLAIALDGTTSAQTYLDIEKILGACRTSGADAVHPGYGFLSENATFAQAVIDAGLTWVGPSPQTIEQMGSKIAAKAAMLAADVPTLPARTVNEADDLAAAAAEIGYPVLVKASAGGGGRGMRVVKSEAELEAAVAGARREAGAAFGDDTVFLERWLQSSRHIEIQILGDHHGNLVHLFERECSIQRRHQKIIEEAPSPAVGAELRARMGDAALRAARDLDYASAGTVEFLLADDEFWFLEVNTRLQVEHPVTEAVTGIDLVREQLRIAEGEPLGYTQDCLGMSGHAIEARLYAENPAKNFLPSPGTVRVWEPSPTVRVDAGVEAGTAVSVFFDPMIAKVIAHAPTRREATAKLARALEATRIQGLTHNRDFLIASLRTDAFAAGDTTTDFIERINPARRRAASAQEQADAAVACSIVSQHARRSNAKVLGFLPSGWRNSLMPPERVRYAAGEDEIAIEYRHTRTGTFEFWVNGSACTVLVHHIEGNDIDLQLDERRMPVRVLRDGDRWMAHSPTGSVELVEQPRFPEPGAAEFHGGLFAPMPGKVLAAEVAAGDRVKAGQLLVILEAMKMEHRITAPVDGTVSEVRVACGEQVANGQLLVMIDSQG